MSDLDLMSSKKLDETIIKPYIKDGNLDLTFKFRSDFNNTKKMRDFIESIFKLFNFGNIWKTRFVLIADELNNNAIEYGTKTGGYNHMRIKINYDVDCMNILLEVEDMGNGVSSKKSKEMKELQKQRETNGFNNHKSIRGRGLFLIINKIVDKLTFKDSQFGGLIVSVEKKLLKGVDY